MLRQNLSSTINFSKIDRVRPIVPPSTTTSISYRLNLPVVIVKNSSFACDSKQFGLHCSKKTPLLPGASFLVLSSLFDSMSGMAANSALVLNIEQRRSSLVSCTIIQRYFFSCLSCFKAFSSYQVSISTADRLYNVQCSRGKAKYH